MRLSESIWIGARLKPQGRGAGSGYTKAPRTCALGAAAAGLGLVTEDYSTTLERLYDALPAYPKSVVLEIWYQNDIKFWSREEIADWLERWEEEHLGPA